MTTKLAKFVVWLSEVKELRARSVEVRADFMHGLARGEQDTAMWSGAGYASFEAVLKGENLVDGSEFPEFKIAVARFTFAYVRLCGVETARLLIHVPEDAPSRQKGETRNAAAAALADLQEFRERNHTTPSTRQAKAIIARHFEAPRVVRAVAGSQEERIAELERENGALRKENSRLTKALTAAEEQLRAVGRRAEGGKRSRSGNATRSHVNTKAKRGKSTSTRTEARA